MSASTVTTTPTGRRGTMGATAYTVGSHVVFRRGSYSPGSPAGMRTLSHELAHVVQQRSGAVDGADRGDGVVVSDPADRFERQADAVAHAAVAPPAPGTTSPTPGSGLPAGTAPATPMPSTRSVQRLLDDPVEDPTMAPAATQAPTAPTAPAASAPAPAPAPAATQDPAVAAVKASTDTVLGVRVGIDPFLASLLEPQAPADPAPLPDDAAAAKQKVTGTAYGTGAKVDPADVSQGGLGDCYLLAMMIAIARVHPEALEKLIKDNGDGSFTVTLYEDHLIGGATPYTETVTSEVPVGNAGSPLYAQVNKRADGSRPLWPLLIEKAYAKHQGSYAAIQGGSGSKAAQVLNQGGGTVHKTADYDEGQIADLIDASVAKNRAITAGTIHRKYDDIANWLQTNLGTPTSEVARVEKQWDIKAPHMYIVKSVDKKAKTIDLINPWGHDHLTGLPLGVFKIAFMDWTEANIPDATPGATPAPAPAPAQTPPPAPPPGP